MRLSTGTLYGIIKRLLDTQMVEEVASRRPTATRLQADAVRQDRRACGSGAA